jgi:hypothetical protein
VLEEENKQLKARIRELQATRRAIELIREAAPPKGGSKPSR